MKKLLLLAALGLGLYAPVSLPTAAVAQNSPCGVNGTNPVGVLCAIGRNPTYSATSVGLVPAASATDIFCISAGAGKNVSIREIKIGGTAGTAITTPFLLYQRATLGTGGTAATGLALPVAASLSPNDVASTAVVTAYTANPTVAATPVLMDSFLVDLPVTTAAGGATEVTHFYGTQVDNFSKGVDLNKGGTAQYCINLNGVSVATGVLSINMQWTEQ